MLLILWQMWHQRSSKLELKWRFAKQGATRDIAHGVRELLILIVNLYCVCNMVGEEGKIYTLFVINYLIES